MACRGPRRATSSLRGAARRRGGAGGLVLLLVMGPGLPGAPAAAGEGEGVRVEAVTQRLDAEGGVRRVRTTLRMEGARLRADAGDGRGSLLYDADAGKAWLLDHREKRYVSVDRSRALALARQAQELRREMRQHLEGRLSPEQMAAAEARLGVAAEQTSGSLRVRETGASDRVAGIACRELEVLEGEERVAELCGAEPDAAGLPPESFDAMREVARFAEETVGSLAPGDLGRHGLALLQGAQDLDVVPLRVRAYQQGELASETQVEQVIREPMPPQAFRLPEGYRAMFQVQVRGRPSP